MRWHEGDVATAITTCKATGSFLLVYIKDATDVSEQVDAVWQDKEISHVFSQARCICLRLPIDSVGGQQFSQFYPVSEVPSIFFLQADGKLVEEIKGSCSKEELQEKANKLFHQQPAGAEAMAGARATTHEETEEEINASSSYTAEEKAAKVERARALIRMKQEKKAAEEKEKERNAEIERRKMGKDLERLKQMKAEQEAKETRDALKKEKEETRLAREKIREQIKKDREARNAKYQQEKAEKEDALRRKQEEKAAKAAEEAAQTAEANSSNARIQFRLPDGSKIYHTFSADETVQSARDIVAMHESNPFGRSFRLSTLYPKRVFTLEDYQSTFRDLSLVPASALMVLPPVAGGDVVQSPPTATGSITQLFTILFSPLIVLWNLIRAFIFTSPTRAPASMSEETAAPTHSEARGSTQPQRRVGRLTDLPPDGDDQNTWNGNSTQQM